MKFIKLMLKNIFSILLCSSSIIAAPTKEQKKCFVDQYDQYIDKIFKNISGFGIPQDEVKKIKAAEGADTYGEITYNAAKKLITYLKIKPTDKVYDLGSGVGKFATQVRLTTDAADVVGIELSDSRFNASQEILKKLKKAGKVTNSRPMKFIYGDIAKANLKDATIIYMCSTCYPEKLMKKLTDKFAKLKKGLKVATLKKLTPNNNFKLLKEFKLPMTWAKNVSVYVYELVQ